MNRGYLFLIPCLIFLSSCFKTTAQIKREKFVDNLQMRFDQNSKMVAELTTQVQDLRNNQMNAQGQLEEINHNKNLAQSEFTQSTQNNMLQLNEQISVLTKRESQNHKKIQSLQAEVTALKSYLKKVTGTLGKISGSSSKSSLQSAHKAFEKNQANKARELYNQVLVEGKINNAQKNHVYFNLGLLDYNSKKFDSALVYFSKIYTKYPKSSLSPRSLLYIARSFKKQNKKVEAKASYSELMKKYPKSKQLKYAKKEIKSL